MPHYCAGGRWLVQAPSSQQLPIQQQIPHLEVLGNVTYAWFGRIPVREASSTVLKHLFRICLIYFSTAPILYPPCPAFINHQRVPLPSHFTSPLSPLWQGHCCLAFALPVLDQCHRPLTVALLTLSTYLHRCHHHCRCNAPISLPLLPTYVPPIGRVLSCHPC